MSLLYLPNANSTSTLIEYYRSKIVFGWTMVGDTKYGFNLPVAKRGGPDTTWVAGNLKTTSRQGVRSVIADASARLRATTNIDASKKHFFMFWHYVNAADIGTGFDIVARNGSGTGTVYVGRKSSGYFYANATVYGTVVPGWNLFIYADQAYATGHDKFHNGNLINQSASTFPTGSQTWDLFNDNFNQPFIEPVAELLVIEADLDYANPASTGYTNAKHIFDAGPGAISGLAPKRRKLIFSTQAAAASFNAFWASRATVVAPPINIGGF